MCASVYMLCVCTYVRVVCVQGCVGVGVGVQGGGGRFCVCVCVCYKRVNHLPGHWLACDPTFEPLATSRHSGCLDGTQTHFHF